MTSGVFVTGMQRAGTTLCGRLVGAHPGVTILSQPFPLLFVEAKRAFMRELTPPAGDVRYPLAHLFLEERYRPREFAAFLSRYRASAETLDRLFGEMATFSGQYTRPDPERLRPAVRRLDRADFASTVADLYRAMSDGPETAVYGGKETLCEEFLPYFLDSGWTAILIVRDPRDVLASLNHGRGQEYGGRLKPTLFNVRNWRKSVAFALHLAGHPRFTWVRYEDVVARPLQSLGRVAAALGVEPFTEAMIDRALTSAAGVRWPGNSSHRRHDGVTIGSIGTYREVLPATVAAYVEATCYPELRCLGYESSIGERDVPQILTTFEEPYEISRPDLARYSTTPADVAAEIRRAQLVREAGCDASESYFLFTDVHARLRDSVLAR
jgi:Sulfotransferase domain